MLALLMMLVNIIIQKRGIFDGIIVNLAALLFYKFKVYIYFK